MRLRFLYRAFRARLRDEKLEIAAFRQALRKGGLGLDIGANKGAYLYWMRRAVGPEGQVYAFEPQPSLYAYLKRIGELMSWKNVSIEPFAITNRTGKIRLIVPAAEGKSSPGAKLQNGSASVLEAAEEEYQVECLAKTLDSIPFDRPVSFVKCDVEGHELQVFQGGRNLLSKDGPALLFECEARHLQGHTMEDVFEFLNNLGYRGFFFAGGEILPVADFDPDIHQRRNRVRYWDQKTYYNNFFFRRID